MNVKISRDRNSGGRISRMTYRSSVFSTGTFRITGRANLG